MSTCAWFSSYLCRWKLQFVKSGFRGQLPKPYSNHKNATWSILEYMNDMNKEEPSRYVSLSLKFTCTVSIDWLLSASLPSSQFDLAGCHYLVDLDLPVSTKREPRYAQDTKVWQMVTKRPFLDAQRSVYHSVDQLSGW